MPFVQWPLCTSVYKNLSEGVTGGRRFEIEPYRMSKCPRKWASTSEWRVVMVKSIQTNLGRSIEFHPEIFFLVFANVRIPTFQTAQVDYWRAISQTQISADSTGHNPQHKNNSLNAYLKLGISLAALPQNNSLSQQETATGMRSRRKIFLVLNKKLLTQSSTAPLSLAKSLESFGSSSNLIVWLHLHVIQPVWAWAGPSWLYFHF